MVNNIIIKSNDTDSMNINEEIKPIITTIIPTYQRPKQLKQAIISALRQTYPYLQVCVYDNASGDETASVVAEIAITDPRVKYHCHSENIGAFNNFQYGLKRVDTPFFSFLSDDDLILPDFYEMALAGFENHPEAMFFAADILHIGQQDRLLRTPLETWVPGVYHPPGGLVSLLEHGHSEWTGILFRKAVTEKIGLLDMGTGRFSDLDFTLRIAAHCPFIISKHVGAVFDGSMVERSPRPFAETWPGILKMVGNITEDDSLPLDVRVYAERVHWTNFKKSLIEWSLSYLSRGYPSDAKKVAALLRTQFGDWVRYIVLSLLINAHQSVPFARLAFDSLIAYRRTLRTKRLSNNPILPASVWWRPYAKEISSSHRDAKSDPV